MQSNFYTSLYQCFTKSKGVDIMEINAIQLRLASSCVQLVKVKKNLLNKEINIILVHDKNSKNNI